MNKGFANFLARVASNKSRDLFIVQLGTQLILNKFALVGVAGAIAGYFLKGILGLLIEDGTFLIDVSLDAYREGQKLKEFEKAAKEAFEKATAKVYEDDEKEAIRQKYLEIISRIGVVGN